MSRLVTFGCSHTYGMGLEDPSKEAWPHVLGKLIGKEKVVNKGNTGASIKEITHTAFNFKFLPTDTVVILWTHLNRYCITGKERCIRINPWFVDKDSLSDYYYKNVHTEYDDMFQSRSFILSTEYVIREKVDSLYHAFSDGKVLNLLSHHLKSKNYHKKHFTRLLKYGLALDNSHLGAKANEIFAKEVCDFINEKDKNLV